MKTYVQLFFLLVLLVSVQGDAEFLKLDDTGSRSFVNISGRNYYISPPQTNNPADEAQYFCRDIGMELVSLETLEEYQAIQDFLDSNNEYDGEGYWTSGHFHLTRFLWRTQEFTYEKWALGEPNQGNCMCVFISGGWKGMFDGECTSNYGFICEDK